MGDCGPRNNKKNEGWTAVAAEAASPELSARMMHHHRDKAVINRIMLRFRPIAPKPAADGSVSDLSKMDAVTVSQRQRPKRRYVRVNNSNNNNNISSRRKCKSTAKEEEKWRDLSFEDGVVQDTTAKTMSFGLSITMSNNNESLGLGLGPGPGPGPGPGSDRAVVESWVVVNGMTETKTMLGGMLGSTDMEKMRNLERDTCPGMITDGEHRVRWVNLAYRRMVTEPGLVGETERRAEEEEEEEVEVKVRVRVELKEEIPEGWAVFACTARVVYTCRKEKYYTKTMPCDVWKMELGGFAWRLDSRAALCLGR